MARKRKTARSKPAPKKRGVGRPQRRLEHLPALGKVLRQIRGSDNVTTAAAKVGKAPAWWSMRESGDSPLSDEDFRRIGEAYGVVFLIGAQISDFRKA